MGNSTIWDGTGWTSAEVDSPYDKARVYIQSSEPTGGRSGDLFVDSDDSTLSYLDGLWRKLKIASTNVIGLETLLSTLAPLVHQHAASDISSGTLDTARIPDLDAGKVTSGTLADARIPNLSASKTTSGTFDVARIPDLDAAKVASGTLAIARIPSLDAAKITTGTLDIDRLPTGTSGTTVALGNHTHTKAHITDFAHTHTAADIVSGTLDVARIPDMDTAKITTGTLPAARLPVATDTEAIAGSLTTKLVTPANVAAVLKQTYAYSPETDFNDFKTTGTYFVSNSVTTLNGPITGTNFGTLKVVRGPDDVTQMLQQTSTPYGLYTRRYQYSTDTWTPWINANTQMVGARVIRTTAGPSLTASVANRISGYTAVDYDDASIIDLATGKITIPTTGRYSITGFVPWANFGSPHRRMLWIGGYASSTTTIKVRWDLSIADRIGAFVYYTGDFVAGDQYCLWYWAAVDNAGGRPDENNTPPTSLTVQRVK